MRRTLQLISLATAMLVSPAFAQTATYCHKVDEYTTVCEFSDGRAHEQTDIGDKSWSTWYTATQWKVRKAKYARDAAKAAREAREQAKKHDEWQAQSEQLEIKARLVESKAACEDAGFIWVVKGELKDGVVEYKGSCHYSEAAMRIHLEKQQAAK